MGSSKSLAVFAAGAALVVSGCTGGEPEADPTPILPESSEPAEPAPSDPSESETAQAEAPEMPDAARERSLDGADAFVRHWTDTLNFASSQGDAAALEGISARSCESCTGAIDFIDRVYENGGRIESDGWQVKRIATEGAASDLDAPILSSTIRRAAETVVRKAGQEEERTPASTFTAIFELERSADGWLVGEVEIA